MSLKNHKKRPDWRRLVLIFAILMISLCVLVVGMIYISNQFLPELSSSPEELTSEDIARAEETLNLLTELGDQTWPSFDSSIPIIMWNDTNAFLINSKEELPDWDELDNVLINDFPIYFQENTANYQAFSEVLINGQYAGSMSTKDATNIKFINLFKENLPPIVSQLVPYRLLLISSDHYVTALVHESFHALQAEVYPTRFEDAEKAYQFGAEYESLFPEMSEDWQSEVKTLITALEEKNPSRQIQHVKDFLQMRDQRRSKAKLAPSLILYEKRFEWLEGSAKYVELEIWRLAHSSTTYQPVAHIEEDKDFNGYENYPSRWKNELISMKNASKSGGDTLFYYSGMMQARLLDQLMPAWKIRMGEPDIWLEDLLREAVN